MMYKSFRLILLVIALLALAGCSQYTFGGPGNEVSLVEDATVVLPVRYLDNNTEGPEYDVSVTLPDDWVGSFETLNRGNSVTFRYLESEDDDNGGVPLFYVEALSHAQYWEQIGSYPGQYYSVKNTGDTHIVYYYPIDSYYAGMDEDQFDELIGMLPEVFASVEVVRVNTSPALVSVQ